MDSLYAITSIFNPCNYKTRYKLYKEFEKRCKDSGIILYTIEAAFKDQDFAVTDKNNNRHIQVRTNDELWIKENLLNIVLDKLPTDANYIAWIDADIIFTHPDIVAATITALQKYSIVQMFSHAVDLDVNHTCLITNGIIKEPQQSACYRFIRTNGFVGLETKEDFNNSIGHTGYAWAATREALNATNGFLDFAILGSADKYMFHGWIDKIFASKKPVFSKEYNLKMEEWTTKALTLNKNIGYVDGLLLHYFHGAKKNRGYQDRWRILEKHQFDPIKDLGITKDGVITFVGNKPELEKDVREYFQSRKEDSTES